jgi:hypothetical protein
VANVASLRPAKSKSAARFLREVKLLIIGNNCRTWKE